MIYCAILGFWIDRETACNVSGDHPLCRQCLGREEKAANPGRQGRKIRKRCERCPEIFLANSNRHRFCPKCRKGAYREKSRQWDQENRENRSQTAN